MADRERLLGRRAALKEKEYNKRVALDTVAKNIIDIFSPVDSAMKYVEAIDMKRLKTQVSDIERNLRDLKELLEEIKKLDGELGDDGH